jgi:hypothetical protein
MDAPSFRALALVLRVELPSAMEDAVREMERARMQKADMESRWHFLVNSLYYGHRLLDHLDISTMNAWEQQEIAESHRVLGRALDSVGIDPADEMEDEEEDDSEMSD